MTKHVNKVIIDISGGVMQSITVDTPTEYILLDYDTEGADYCDLGIVDGNEVIVAQGMADIDIDRVQRVFEECNPNTSGYTIRHYKFTN